jgi:signal transduction histidine kinase
MKIRTRLILLALGSILIPIVIMLIAWYLGYRYSEERKPITPRMTDRIIADFERSLAAYVEKEGASGALPAGGGVAFVPPDIPEGLRALLLDGERTVLFSNVEGIPVGTGRDEWPLLMFSPDAQEGDGRMSRFLMSIPLWVKEEVRGTLILGIPSPPASGGKRPPRRPPLYLRILDRGALGFGAFVLFASVMVFFIVRSVNRSTRKLEYATRRVAEGDLNFELVPRGNDELASLTRSFESMRRELGESRAQRSRFLMGVSHDLKTPLTSIEGYLEAVRDGLADTPEKLTRYLSIIGEKTGVLKERIVHLIDYVKMETGEWKLNNERVLLADFLRNVAAVCGEEASLFKRSFAAHIDLPPGLAVCGDRSLLTRAFENLMSNALQYAGENDSISLDALKAGEEVTIAFSDTGPGIPRDQIQRIFEPLYRGSTSRSGRGTGLGLTVVRSIFNSHGWTIGVDSSPGEGVAFTIVVPLAGGTGTGEEGAPC